jgi:16S rRNA (guanine966-N2)-methyltransferase
MAAAANNPRNRLRIIGGEWRSRMVSFADIKDIRPTPDRVRETLFNWLQPHIVGAYCLDLFAGSGVLGFEALSRGATSVHTLELDPQAAAAIRHNMQLLKTEHMHLLQKNALDWLQHNLDGLQFDVVFIDPPFAAGLYEVCCQLLQEKNWLCAHALIYLESDQAPDKLKLPAGWTLLRNKRAGSVYYSLWQLS